jgi:lipoprotein NlpD
MILIRTAFCVSVLAFAVSGCGTSGFDDIKARHKIGTERTAPRPIPKSKPVKMASRRMTRPVNRKPPSEQMPVVTATAPVATPLPPPDEAAGQSQIVSIPAGRVSVEKGETLHGVSRRTGVTVQDLASANNLSQPYVLTTGQAITVPAVRYYVVQPGETANKIARERGVSLTQIAALNTLGDNYAVKRGQKLRLPLDMILPPTAEEKRTAKNAPVDATGETRTASVASSSVPQASPTEPPAAAIPPVVASMPSPVFDWPLDGKILSEFGAKPNGQFNDGVNIAARTGQSVRAAADGEIVFASNQLKGFGNLLLIRHKNGWLTAYAHNEALLVKKGMKVQRGEVVARAGSTGSVRSPQLHFEVRHNRKPVSPLRVLPDHVSPDRSLTAITPEQPQVDQPNPG